MAWTQAAAHAPSFFAVGGSSTNVEELAGMVTVDPGVPYDYRPGQGSRYELCGVFARGSELSPGMVGPNPWAHGAGRQCFALDTVGMLRYPQ